MTYPTLLILFLLLLGASRERKDWNKIKKESTSSFEIVASPSHDDYEILATSIFEFIELVMEFESTSQFPSLEQAKLLLEDKEKLNYFPTKISKVGGAIKLPPASNDIVTGDREGSGETFTSSYESNYDANDATVDVPMKHDLAADKTLEILLSYSEKLAENSLKDDKSEEEDFLPIMAHLSPYLLGDGNPIWGIYKLLRKNEGKYSKRRMPAYFGGFHLVLETHKKRGSLFGSSHLCDVFRNWRNSDTQLEWVMDPGDPSQVDDEMAMYHLGKFTKILISLTFCYYQIYLFCLNSFLFYFIILFLLILIFNLYLQQCMLLPCVA